MNAYSTINAGQSTRRRRLLSKAYRKGLREGIAAPTLFFVPLSFPRTEAIDASLNNAWKAVGQALERARERGAEEVGKSPGKITKFKRDSTR